MNKSTMDEINLLLQDVEKLRVNLHKLIYEKNNDLQDLEVITASQMLNSMIVKYNEIIKNK